MAETASKEIAKEETLASVVSVEDEALNEIEYSEAEENALRRKLDKNIIPWVTAMYLLSYLDRVNIGNAKIVNSDLSGVGEFDHDLGLSSSQYSWSVSIFFFGYVIFEVPSNLMLKKLKPSRWLSRIMVSWGICASCLAAVNSFSSLMAVRFLLGLMEAGLFPGILFYLTFWYRKHEQARRVSWFFAAASAAGAFGGLLAFAISRMDGLGNLQGWQWVFLIEGLPTIVFGVAVWFGLPDMPSTAKFLTRDERAIANARLRKDHVDADEVEFSWSQFKAAVSDVKVWISMLLYFGLLVPLYSVSFFLPTIVRGMGFSSLDAQAMTVPIYAIACVASIATGFSSDYFRDRSLHLLGGTVLSSICFFLMAYIRDRTVLYVITCFMAIGVFMSIPVSLSWLSNNMVGSTKGGTGIAMMVAFGNIGGAVAGQIYRTMDSPWYQFGHLINGSLLICSFCLSLGLRFYLINENKKRDAAYGPIEQGAVVGGSKGGSSSAPSEDSPSFRYQL